MGLVGAPNLKVQMDPHHCQIVEGDVAMKILKLLTMTDVGHFLITNVPKQHEPDVNELNCRYLFNVIAEVATNTNGKAGWTANIGL